jgi:hypothetical protein
MSGGHFDYKQYELSYIEDVLKDLIEQNDDETLDEFGDKRGRGYSEAVMNEFRTTLLLLKLARTCVHRIDWLVSGDDSEETFLKRLKEDLREFT